MTASWLWVVFTLLAAVGQTVRNAMQRELTATLGTAGATHVRFLFGFPFALILLVVVLIVTRHPLPWPDGWYWLWLLGGALTQVAATALMLAAMGERSFVVAYAYIKTEPVQVAVFGLIFLGDVLSPLAIAAIIIATAGVIVMAIKPGAAGAASIRPTLLGLASGSCFALSAVIYRGAILKLQLPDFVVAATYTLAVGLVVQTAVLTGWLLLRDRATLIAIARAWRPSLLAGFMGSMASEFWFLAFAIATAASVRTLGLIEVLFAQLISSFVFKQKTTLRETAGIVLVVAGVILLLWAH